MNLIIFGGLLGVVMMFGGLLMKQKHQATLLATVLMALLLVLNSWELYHDPVFVVNTKDMLETTRFGLLLNEIMLAAGLIYFLLSGRDIEKVGNHVAEYYALMFFIFAGVGIATSYTNLLMLFLGIEIISIPLYILTAADKRNLKSVEAGLKYFLMGSFSTGIMLMGIALIYGGTGSFLLTKFSILGAPMSYNLVGGMLLVLVAMAFKVSAAPFHFWTPDVYDGAPTVFTSFMATIVKVAALVAFVKLFEGSYSIIEGKWQMVMAIIIALTLLIGNITAVFQQSVKRMLAYSSIAQAGFMLFALFAMNNWGKEGIVLYAAAYSLATIGLFAVLAKMEDYTFNGFNGFSKREPMIAVALTIFLLSLAGIPLTVGFFSKYYMVAAAAATGGKYLWLMILAMLCAAISVYYYFRVIQAMYFKDGEIVSSLPVAPAFRYLLIGVAAIVIFLGVMPQWILQYLYF
ncbi:MAG: NADH-quinone oxidoreductase subunit N [Bacteroidetes bacterium]|uniref:NADH-quinone oxidoreductase subunit N n=1 Tax=unclassified Phnomibacter TaxID=2836226 RepID=UPI002FDE3BF1|nr:NADH-quinone oxidoreductase subunit N [Bacteroidota bacterium]MCC6760136.1 NADH-quinone oxidoreductase subunit N [Chitinophagaceae bacterium]